MAIEHVNQLLYNFITSSYGSKLVRSAWMPIEASLSQTKKLNNWWHSTTVQKIEWVHFHPGSVGSVLNHKTATDNKLKNFFLALNQFGSV